MKLAERIAAEYMLKEAKRKHLKAIDFTIGLVRRLSSAGAKLPGGSNEGVIKRLIDMRRASQIKGFRMETLLENKTLLTGKGSTILKVLEKNEAKVLPNERHLAGFVKEYPNKSPSAQDAQAKKWGVKIASMTGEDAGTIEARVMEDWEFFQIAYDIVLPDMLKAKSAMDGTIGSSAEGTYKSREKAAPNTFKKQPRAGESFLRFKDLAGCMVITPTVANMAAVAVATQGKFEVVQKKNWYLRNAGFNAINYVFTNAGTLCEFQLKTDINAMEAALSHDLIYAPEKAIVSLSGEEKKMVAGVIDVSTQLSMREWSDTFDIAMKMASLADRVAFRSATSL